MNIVVFEDGLHDNFYPLSLTRPLWELRSGLYSFRERLEKFVEKHDLLSGGEMYYFTRDYLVTYCRELYPHVRINDYSVFHTGGEIFFINAVKYPSEADFAIERDSVVTLGPVPVLARVTSEIKPHSNSVPAAVMRSGLKVVDYYDAYDAPGIGPKANYIWELVEWNGDTIAEDFRSSGLEGCIRKDVTILGEPGQVYIEDGASFEPSVVVDATAGPVFIGAGTRVRAFTRIQGPCNIGRDCVIVGAKVGGGTSIGPCCRIGGEIEQTIFHGYGNKYHDGFIGHSYIGAWVNLGALTTNSDLKNDYSNVKVYTPNARRKTGLKKVGCFMGDFVKTSIGTLINTGTSIGPGAMLVHAGNLTPFHIPPFSWYIDSSVARFDWLDDFLAAAREAMARRNVDMTEHFVTLINTVYAMTSSER